MDAIELFQYFINEFRKIGETQLHPANTRIALSNGFRFASVNHLSQTSLTGHLILPDKNDYSLFHRIEKISENCLVHHFKISKFADLTDEFKQLMKKAYD